MFTIVFVLAVVVGPIVVFGGIHQFFRWVAEGDPYMRSLATENVRDQVERPQIWRS